MSSSSPPVLMGRNIRPKARDSTLEFWWGYPASDGAILGEGAHGILHAIISKKFLSK